MKPLSSLKYFFLSNFSKPSCNRMVYKAIKQAKVSSIIEIGVGDAVRAETMIRVARKFSSSGAVRYTGIDGFETNPNSTLTLKECHQRLTQHDAKIQLVPGEIYPSLHRIANSHTRTDLLLISAGYDEAELDKCWFYVPRMLHAASAVFMQNTKDPEGKFTKLSRLEIERKANAKTGLKTQAA